MGKAILMGRKTFDSMNHPLPGRMNIVITSREMNIDGCAVAHSLGEAMISAGETEELMVMGGAQIYKLALPRANRLYITEIHAMLKGNTYFPAFDESEWLDTYRENHEPDAKNAYPYSFRILERVANPYDS